MPSPPPLVRAPNLSAREGLVHGFTTRDGGVSEGGLATLNLALRADETPDRVTENWSRVVRALHPGLLPGAVALTNQVHGVAVVEVREGRGPLAGVADADAAFTTVPGVVLAVRVADCVPVIVAGSGIVGVAHAGWRGTVGCVVQALIRAMGVPPHTLSAAVGPCISGAVYEVGDEVIDGLRAAGLPDAAFRVDGTRRVDLARAVGAQLVGAGVTDVSTVGRCTATDPAFYSHRRDGPGCGRFAGVVALC